MQPNENITLRPAQPDDVKKAVLLLYSAFTHKKVDYPSEINDKEGFIKPLRHFFGQEKNRFSYQYALIAEVNGEIVGMVVSFAGKDEEELNTATGWSMEREAHDDDWYVDALAVFKNGGHQGVGTRLLETAEEIAQQHHFSHVALNVAKENVEAYAFYQHRNYVPDGETSFYGHQYIRMFKQLDHK